MLFKSYIRNYSKFHVIYITRLGIFRFEVLQTVWMSVLHKSLRMRVTDILLFLAASDCVANIEMNKYEEEKKAELQQNSFPSV